MNRTTSGYGYAGTVAGLAALLLIWMPVEATGRAASEAGPPMTAHYQVSETDWDSKAVRLQGSDIWPSSLERPEVFGPVAAVAKGRFAVVDHSRGVLILVDEGKAEVVLRFGQGPAELMSIDGIHVLDGEFAAVSYLRSGVAQVLSSDGTHVRRVTGISGTTCVCEDEWYSLRPSAAGLELLQIDRGEARSVRLFSELSGAAPIAGATAVSAAAFPVFACHGDTIWLGNEYHRRVVALSTESGSELMTLTWGPDSSQSSESAPTVVKSGSRLYTASLSADENGFLFVGLGDVGVSGEGMHTRILVLDSRGDLVELLRLEPGGFPRYLCASEGVLAVAGGGYADLAMWYDYSAMIPGWQRRE